MRSYRELLSIIIPFFFLDFGQECLIKIRKIVLKNKKLVNVYNIFSNRKPRIFEEDIDWRKKEVYRQHFPVLC